MLEQHVRVVTSSHDGVWVEAVEPSGCGTCGGQGCSTRQIAELFQRTPRQFCVESQFELSAGDRVVVGVPDGSVIRIALRVYGLPLLLILAGALLAEAWVPGDASAVLGVLAGGVVAWGLISGGASHHPVVIRRDDVDGVLVRKGN